MINYVEYLNIPSKVALIVIIVFFVIQAIGELLEFRGLIVPEFVKIRKYFKRKKEERKTLAQMPVMFNEMKTLVEETKSLLSDVNEHYSADNIAKRDSWMQWVNDRAIVYDASVGEVGKISENLTNVTEALKECTKMTEEMFVQSSRDRIIDFASKVSDVNSPVSKEEFNRILKVHEKYEDFLEEHELTNGEVDIAYRIIKESYEEHMRNHSFIEDVRGYELS